MQNIHLLSVFPFTGEKYEYCCSTLLFCLVKSAGYIEIATHKASNSCSLNVPNVFKRIPCLIIINCNFISRYHITLSELFMLRHCVTLLTDCIGNISRTVSRQLRIDLIKAMYYNRI